MFASSVELERKLREEIKCREDDIRRLKSEMDKLRWEKEEIEKREEFKIEKAKFEKAKEMEKALIESDLKRVEAVAKYNAYADMDTKDERKHIEKMLEKAIEGLSKGIQVIQTAK